MKIPMTNHYKLLIHTCRDQNYLIIIENNDREFN